MLYYWLHVVYLYIGSKFFWKKLEPHNTFSRYRRATPFDCEGFRYMSNTRYVYYMDFMRFEILFRSNLYNATIKKGILPTLGSQKVIYKKPLKIWQKFKVTLINEGWDDKYVYHRQNFSRNGELYAIGFTKVAFWKNKKVQNMYQIIRDCGIEINRKPPQEVLDIFRPDYNHLNKSSLMDN